MKILIRLAVVFAAVVALGLAALAILLPRIVKSDAVRARIETAAYDALGRELRYRDLSPGLLREYLARGNPVLTGLSATYLYGSVRERGLEYDDVGGDPVGHFVVLSGYDREKREVLVADPLKDNPPFGSHYYTVGLDRLVGAILLGIVTYDANLLILRPREPETR